jgi:dihydrofolate synthase/folylpolyglutamate synthase
MAARPAEEVAQIAADVGLTAYVASSVEAALESLSDIAFERPPRILICGSLYLAGNVLTANGTPPT